MKCLYVQHFLDLRFVYNYREPHSNNGSCFDDLTSAPYIPRHLCVVEKTFELATKGSQNKVATKYSDCSVSGRFRLIP